MAKMTDKKPAKAKSKVKSSPRKAKVATARTPSPAQTAEALLSEVHRPGVQRRRSRQGRFAVA